MTIPKAKKAIVQVLENIEHRARQERLGNPEFQFYANGLRSEGYIGGYTDALDDVLSLLNNDFPNRRQLWKETKSES
jgi:hypothetical protein